MSILHLHLILNHFPIVGAVLASMLLAIALVRRSDELVKVSLSLFALIGLVSVVVFLTGEPAEEAVEHLAGFSHGVVERHEESALVATIVMAFLATVSGVVLFALRKRPVPRMFTVSILAAALGATATMGWTAYLGGQVRHTEIRPGVVTQVDDHDHEVDRR